MTTGEHLGGVVAGTIAVLHGLMMSYVEVTAVNASDGSGYLRFEVLPAGVSLCELLADIAPSMVDAAVQGMFATASFVLTMVVSI